MRNLINSIQKSVRSFGHAFHGLGNLLKLENNIRYQIAAAVVAVVLGFYLRVSANEWLIIIIIIGLVLMAEAFNTAIEELCDIVHADYHEKIKLVKDVSAGAVLITAIAAVIVGVIIFGSRLQGPIAQLLDF